MKACVEALTKLPGVWRGGELEHALQPVVPTGHAALDRELPGGGWPTGTLSEVLHDGVGIGEVTFLAHALARACAANRMLAWVNPPHLPYAPALAQAGIALERCLVIRPAY
ncbi:MAG TPA: SOS cell division inhibitor SulA, partial [Usitatibacter sp.]|nr:SOS cell division inhibitor SulA [Usitatibacter sp.]